jgi:hypothetical protein
MTPTPSYHKLLRLGQEGIAMSLHFPGLSFPSCKRGGRFCSFSPPLEPFQKGGTSFQNLTFQLP